MPKRAASSKTRRARSVGRTGANADRRRRTPRPRRDSPPREPAPQLPRDVDNAVLAIGDRRVKVTNLRKPFWPELGVTKGDLLQFYIDLAPALLPHLRNRAMVMKRYPHGIRGKFFFMKRAPSPRPEWVGTCSIAHGSGNVIDFPIVDDLASLVWLVNLGCIDLNPWYARCDDVDRPDYLHFDLDPVETEGKPEVPLQRVLETALIVRDALAALGLPAYPKTTGSRGIHIYVPIRRGPTQKEVWAIAKRTAQTLAKAHPSLITAEYRKAKRPAGRVLVDYNQNAWGRTLASVYSVRPKPLAPVSAPVAWEEIERGLRIENFRIDTMRERVARLGDLFAPVIGDAARVDLSPHVTRTRSRQ